MILAGPSSASGGLAFPDPPKGSPGAIGAAARSLTEAAGDLERTESGLRGASASLQADWQGWAAQAYHGCSDGLALVARGGAETFHECAHAVTGYATALDSAQSEIRRLRLQWEDAKRRQGAAQGLASHLGTALVAAHKHADITRLEGQTTTADNQARDAGIEADAIARRAVHVLEDFKHAADRCTQVLSGIRPGRPGGPLGSPFTPAGAPGPGFGVPFSSFNLPGNGATVDPHALDPFAGVLPTGLPGPPQIPGLGLYLDEQHPGAVGTSDLTDLIVALATGGAGALKDLGENGLRALAESLGIGATGRAAVTASGIEAKLAAEVGNLRKIVQLDKNGNPILDASGNPIVTTMPGKYSAQTLAELAKRASQVDGRIKIGSELASRLGDAGALPLPPMVREVLTHVAENRVVFGAATVVKLVAARDVLLRAGGPVAARAASAISSILARLGA